MKIFLKWFVTTLVVFLFLCGVSYHDTTNNDGSLYFGFPKEIYHKSVMVMQAATGEVGSAESFYGINLLIDILFAAVLSIILVAVFQRRIKQRKR